MKETLTAEQMQAACQQPVTRSDTHSIVTTWSTQSKNGQTLQQQTLAS